MRARLPAGTVTFLFTDIEGSTRLWEERPEPMRCALARHDELLRHCVQSNGGVVFKSTGDGCAAAFLTAPDALGAALAAQQCLTRETWPEPVELRVRIALQTGSALTFMDEYIPDPRPSSD